jgi:hypothetical protein
MPATDQEILAHHLVYEVEMLVSTLVRLEAGIRDDRVMAYAFIESFSLHARNLIEFFQLPKPDRDKAKWALICSRTSRIALWQRLS